jgi:hypothetical protein
MGGKLTMKEIERYSRLKELLASGLKGEMYKGALSEYMKLKRKRLNIL